MNPLALENDVKNFILEEELRAKVSFPSKRMRLESLLDTAINQDVCYVYWCDRDFLSDALIEWDFTPLTDTGYA